MKKMKIKLGMDVEALQKALQSETQRVKQLEEQNRQLKKQLQKARTVTAKQRQRMRSQAGSLKAARIKVAKLRSQLTRTRTQLSKARTRIANTPKIKSVTHRTMAEYLEQVKPKFIERFIQRIHEAYPDFKAEWDDTVRKALMSMDYARIDAELRENNYGSMYYESNGYTPNTGVTGEQIYAHFLQYVPSEAA